MLRWWITISLNNWCRFSRLQAFCSVFFFPTLLILLEQYWCLFAFLFFFNFGSLLLLKSTKKVKFHQEIAENNWTQNYLYIKLKKEHFTKPNKNKMFQRLILLLLFRKVLWFSTEQMLEWRFRCVFAVTMPALKIHGINMSLAKHITLHIREYDMPCGRLMTTFILVEDPTGYTS